MKTIAIGLHVQSKQDNLDLSLAFIAANTTRPVQVLILADGTEVPAGNQQSALTDLSVFRTREIRGAPACFNRLIAASDARIVIFLESGVLVGPGWLEMLLAPLDADPRNGLAGPSANRAWNEQGILPHSGSTPEGVAEAAMTCRRRFGRTWQSLAPLHSLGAFCYAVKREVIQSIGAADEKYGLGPCWEMDYTIRAVRAGFNAVWSCSAYVHRSPLSAKRIKNEALFFEAGKRRYQDKFCGRQLRAQARSYRSHCRGEACAHFAPPALIRTHIPLPGRPTVVKPKIAAPMVSCIMPTHGRSDFALQSVVYFKRQDYPGRELIILDDGPDDLSPRLPPDPRIRYHRLKPGQSIGAKRNLGCNLARGSLIACWDDDDWYAPERLSRQIEALQARKAQMCGLGVDIFFDLNKWEFWGCSPGLHRRLWFGDVAAGTLVFHRHVWEQLAKYPDQSLAEDGQFLRQAMHRGARLVRLGDEQLFIYLRHGRNSWSFVCGAHHNPDEWQRRPEPAFSPADRAFYCKMAVKHAAVP